jgi:hypothetical protein
MKAPRYRIYGWSWLGVLNFVVLQWFFVRLEASIETPVIPGKSEMTLGWITHIVPLTGWWGYYRYWP